MELVSLNTTHPDNRRMSFKKMGSGVLDVHLFAALTYQFRGVANVRPDKAVARMLKAYAPGRTAVVQPPKPKIVPPKEELKLAVKEPEPPPLSSSGWHHQ